MISVQIIWENCCRTISGCDVGHFSAHSWSLLSLPFIFFFLKNFLGNVSLIYYWLQWCCSETRLLKISMFELEMDNQILLSAGFVAALLLLLMFPRFLHPTALGQCRNSAVQQISGDECHQSDAQGWGRHAGHGPVSVTASLSWVQAMISVHVRFVDVY